MAKYRKLWQQLSRLYQYQVGVVIPGGRWAGGDALVHVLSFTLLYACNVLYYMCR